MKELLVLYGSQTGTAEEVAFRICDLASRREFQANAMPMDAFAGRDADWLDRLAAVPLVLFVCSTTGDGEVPSNMKTFWKALLRKSIPRDVLSTTQFSVFGLGDSSYEKFNAVARRLNTRLKQLGATELNPIGLGDDQSAGGYFDSFDPWQKNLWLQLGVDYAVDDSPRMWETYHVAQFSSTPLGTFSEHGMPSPVAEQDLLTPGSITARVRCNRRLTSDMAAAHVHHVELDTPGITYRAGDVAVIRPTNEVSAIQRMLAIMEECVAAHGLVSTDGERLRMSANLRDIYVNLQRVRAGQELSTLGSLQCSIYELLERGLEIEGMPQRIFLERLSLFCSGEMEEEQRSKLVEMSTSEGADLFTDYIIRARRSFIDVLEDFTSARPPLNRLIDMIPPLRARSYSIASSPAAHPDQLHLCSVVVTYRTRFKRPKQGVCSRLLASVQPGDSIRLYVRKGLLHDIPPNAPLLVVTAGTGVAPMRALAQERSVIDVSSFAEPPSDLLLFGCRHESADYLYGEEWQRYNALQPPRGKLFPAFSRDSRAAQAIGLDRPDRGVYVQDLLEHNPKVGEEAWRLLSLPDSCVFIAGNTKMPKGVKDAIIQLVCRFGDAPVDAAEAFVKSLVSRGRYHVEAWE